jgi:hypothetical protein
MHCSCWYFFCVAFSPINWWICFFELRISTYYGVYFLLSVWLHWGCQSFRYLILKHLTLIGCKWLLGKLKLEGFFILDRWPKFAA